MDAHANFAYSTVATAPSPATSGTSLIVAGGQGALFPAAPFNATVWPVGVAPTTTNAEIVRVTGISTDTFTIVRTQESTSARTVIIGDQISATITAKTLVDAEQANPYIRSGQWIAPPISGVQNVQPSADGLIRCLPMFVLGRTTIQKAAFQVNTGGSAGSVVRIGVWDYAGNLVKDCGTGSSTGTGIIQISTSFSLNYGVYLVAAVNQGAVVTRPFLEHYGPPDGIGTMLMGQDDFSTGANFGDFSANRRTDAVAQTGAFGSLSFIDTSSSAGAPVVAFKVA